MSLAELSEQEIIRRNSLNELKNLGINAYPAPEFKVTHLSKEILNKFEKSPEELWVRLHFLNYRMPKVGFKST